MDRIMCYAIIQQHLLCYHWMPRPFIFKLSILMMLPFPIYPQLFFESTVTNIPMTPTTPSENFRSPSPSLSPIPTSSKTPQEALPDHEKFSVEQKDFLRSHMPAYRAHCAELDRLGRGPRKLAGVKGSKQDWVYKQVYPEFSRKFSSGSNTQSLKQCVVLLECFYPVPAILIAVY
jgi:hypothetical protein